VVSHSSEDLKKDLGAEIRTSKRVKVKITSIQGPQIKPVVKDQLNFLLALQF
jgi:hypothetical protein